MKTISKSTKAWLVYAAAALGTFALGVVLIELHCRYEASQLTEGGFEALSVFFMAWLELLCGLIPLLLLEFELFLIIRRRIILKTKPMRVECVFSIVSCASAILSLTALPFALVVILLCPAAFISFEIGLYGSLCATFLWILIRVPFGIATAVTTVAMHFHTQKNGLQAEK